MKINWLNLFPYPDNTNKNTSAKLTSLEPSNAFSYEEKYIKHKCQFIQSIRLKLQPRTVYVRKQIEMNL